MEEKIRQFGRAGSPPKSGMSVSNSPTQSSAAETNAAAANSVNSSAPGEHAKRLDVLCSLVRSDDHGLRTSARRGSGSRTGSCEARCTAHLGRSVARRANVLPRARTSEICEISTGRGRSLRSSRDDRSGGVLQECSAVLVDLFVDVVRRRLPHGPPRRRGGLVVGKRLAARLRPRSPGSM